MNHLAAPDSNESKFNIFFSSSVSGKISNLLGAAHYSYRFAEQKIISALQNGGIDPKKLMMPEYYSDASAVPAEMRMGDADDIHLIFRSTEQVRLLKFAWNICCFAWEFDVIKDHTKVGEHPFLNQKRMLALCDEVWVPCAYTKRILADYGLLNTHVIPAPIYANQDAKKDVYEILADIGDMSVVPLNHNFLLSKEQNKESCADLSSTLIEFMARRLRDASPVRVYLTVLNPEDYRKNLDAIIRAFHYFSEIQSDAVLLVKVLTSSTRYSLLDVVSDVVPHKLSGGTGILNKNIVFFNDYLTDENMRRLYTLADFYLCASVCEGQNLPLLEAMGCGVVPVTTAGTAMEDYITTKNSVIIQDRLIQNDSEHLAGTLAGRPFSIRRSYVADIFKALRRSASLAPSEYMAMSENARWVVQQQFSEGEILSRMLARFQTIKGEVERKRGL
jgi:glycosyltransferase involved in cell wall biosynthesis